MLQLIFKPESNQFEKTTQEYEAIWREEKEQIIEAFKEVTGLDFKQREIEVVIYEGPSFSGNLKTPMKLRSSYSHEIKLGTLVHELGHRLIAPMHNRIEGVDEHRTLDLFLYSVWVKLCGKEFADRLVTIECKRKGLYDYESAWKWFLDLSELERNEIWGRFINLNM